jgi:hypothetical protein
MKQSVRLAIVFFGLALPMLPKNQPDPDMLAIRKVYVTGHNVGQVEWADNKFPQNKGSCVKPVSTPEEADAILQIEPAFIENEAPVDYQSPTWVSCTSSTHSTHCLDSSGYAMDTSCFADRRGNLTCTSSYGPDLGAAIISALQESARRSVVNVYLYSKDGKHLLWSQIKGSTTFHTWADALNKAVGCVQQKCPVTHFKPCDTRWYDPTQLGPNGKLK